MVNHPNRGGCSPARLAHALALGKMSDLTMHQRWFFSDIYNFWVAKPPGDGTPVRLYTFSLADGGNFAEVEC